MSKRENYTKNSIKEISLMETIQRIRQKIRNSPTAQKLDSIERWSLFRSEANERESREYWLELLGPTAVVLSHQEYFTDFVMNWLTGLSYEDFEKIVLAAAIHDLGEAIVGDKPATEKDDKSENEENSAGIKVIKSIGFEESTQLLNIYKAVVTGKNKELNQIFKAIEVMEHLETAINVFTALKNGKKMKLGLSLVTQVLLFTLPKNLEFAKKLPHINANFLIFHCHTISAMFAETNVNTLNSSLNDSDLQKYQNAKEQWTDFLSNIKQ